MRWIEWNSIVIEPNFSLKAFKCKCYSINILWVDPEGMKTKDNRRIKFGRVVFRK